MIIGILLIVLGVCALIFPAITYFTTERVADAGFFVVDVHKPHTIVLNPIVGIVAIAGGVACLFAGSSRRSLT
jgi:uncharacterized membrane protein HdeD (DUF308 family)